MEVSNPKPISKSTGGSFMAVDAELIGRRFRSTLEYLLHLERLDGVIAWRASYERFQAGVAPIEEALALAHPRHLVDVDDAAFIRGRRQFNERTSAEWCRCQSVLVWGYDCPISATTFQADHLFPFEAGGPTTVDNRIWLCPAHNRVKSSDVHLFPWEEPVPGWLAPKLEVMAARLTT